MTIAIFFCIVFAPSATLVLLFTPRCGHLSIVHIVTPALFRALLDGGLYVLLLTTPVILLQSMNSEDLSRKDSNTKRNFPILLHDKIQKI